MNPIQTAIRQPVTVTVGVILVLLAGFISLERIPIQLTPNVEDTVVSVTTWWEGASPEEIEQEIVDKQEEKLQGVTGLRALTSSCQQGQGTVKLEFEVGIPKETALREVSDKLREVARYPENAYEPVISASDPENRDYIAWLVFECTDPEVDVRTLGDFAEDRIKPVMERAEGIAEINVLGGREREVQIRFDPLLVAQRGLTLTQVIAAIQRTNQNLSAGMLEEAKSDVRLRLVSQYQSVRDVEDTVIAETEGGPVFVRDVAEVVQAHKEPFSFVRSRGVPVIAINAQKEVGANVMAVMRNLKAAVAELNRPGGALDSHARELGLEGKLSIEQVYDQTIYIQDALDLVQTNIWLGGGLALLMLLLFLRSVRSAGIVALAIPISVVGAVVAMVALGRTVNVISLAGMAFAVGMVVDNAIVVLENIYRHLEMGKGARRAALDGTREVFGAVLASTLTTVAVFIPILLVEEEAGQLFRDIALAIVAAVSLSLIVSITVIPTSAARLLVRLGAKRAERAASAPDRKRSLLRCVLGFPARIPDWNAGLVHWLCGSWLARIGIVALLTFLSIWGTTRLMPPADYLPQGNRNMVFGLMIPPPGYNLERLGEVAERIEDTIGPFWEAGQHEPGSPEYEEAVAELEPVPTLDYFRMAPGDPIVPPPLSDYFLVSFAGIMFHGGVTTEPERVVDLQPLFQHASRAEVVPGFMSYSFKMPLFRVGGSTGSAVKINFSGDDLGQVSRAALAVFMEMMGRFGPQSVQPEPSNFNVPGPEMQVIPNRVRLAEVGMTPAELGQAVQALGDGAIIGEYRIGGQTIDLKLVSARAGEAGSLAGLAETPVATPAGFAVPLGSLADVRRLDSAVQINRDSRRRAVTLQFTAPEGMPLEAAVGEVEALLAAARERGALPPQVETGYTGSASKLQAVKTALLGDGSLMSTLTSSLVMALVVVYLLMCVLFQSFGLPLVILFSVPLATLGGFAALYGVFIWSVLDPHMPLQNLDVLTMLGFVILIGVVVNNAILIVHQSLNFMRGRKSEDGWEQEPLPPRRAISEAVRTRVRPIFMSTLTSIGGMSPLIFMPGSGSELYRGLGSVVVGGLLVSTIFTLLLVPLLLSLFTDMQQKLGFLREGRKGVPAALLALLALGLFWTPGCKGPRTWSPPPAPVGVAEDLTLAELDRLGPGADREQSLAQAASSVQDELGERREELERLGGPTSFAQVELGFAPDLKGAEQAFVPIAEDRAVRSTLANDLGLEAARIAPEMDAADLMQAEAAFDPVYFGSLEYDHSDDPNVVPVLGGFPLGTSESVSDLGRLSAGTHRLMGSGGTLTVSAFLERYKSHTSGIAFDPDPAVRSGVAVGISQPLWRGKGAVAEQAQRELSRNQTQRSEHQLAAERLEKTALARRTFWDLAEAWEVLRIQQRLLERGEEIERVLAERRAFDATPTQYSDALATVEARRTNLVRAQRIVRAASDRLKRLMNDPELPLGSEELLRPEASPRLEPLAFELREAVETALRERPELAAALLSVEDAGIGEEIARDRLRPQLDLLAEVAVAGLDDDEAGTWQSLAEDDHFSYLLGLSFELPQGNRAAKAEVRKEQMRARVALIRYEDAVLEVVREVKEALRDLATSYELIAAARTARVARTENLRALLVEEEQRGRLTPEFLSLEFQAQERLAVAQLEEAAAVADYQRALAAYRRVLGVGGGE